MRNEGRQVVSARVRLGSKAPEEVDLPVVDPGRELVHSQWLLSGRVKLLPGERVKVEDERAVRVLLDDAASF